MLQRSMHTSISSLRTRCTRELEKQELTLPEVITLASFVQEEAGNDAGFQCGAGVPQPSGRGIASTPSSTATPPAMSRAMRTTTTSGTGWSSVLWRLGGDPREHPQCLTIPTPATGLPAGPISNPGLAAIQAALAPQCDRGSQGLLFLCYGPFRPLLLRQDLC